MNRRGFLQAILAAGVAPAVVGSGILMPVRQIARQRSILFDGPVGCQPYTGGPIMTLDEFCKLYPGMFEDAAERNLIATPLAHFLEFRGARPT